MKKNSQCKLTSTARNTIVRYTFYCYLLLKLYLLYLNKRKEIFESTISSSDQKLRKQKDPTWLLSSLFTKFIYRGLRIVSVRLKVDRKLGKPSI